MKKLFISVLIGLVALALFPQLASAQDMQFGKNLVVNKIDWKIYESEHFQIHYYFPNKNDWAKEKEYISDMIRWVETAYQVNNNKLAVDKPFYDTLEKKYYKPPVFVFWSRSNADHYPLFGPNSGIAYSEPIKMRMVCVSKEYPEEKNQQIITHEIAHLFQFDIWKLSHKTISQLSSMWDRLLTFIFEGLSQHISGLHRTEPNCRLLVRYFVLNDVLKLINIKDWAMYPSLSSSYEICYCIGGYFYDWIEETYGTDTFRNFVKEFRKATLTAQGFERVVNMVLKTDLAELDRAFRKYMEDQYKLFPLEKKEAWEYGRDILLQRRFFQGGFFKPVPKPGETEKKKVDAVYEPVISPSGDLVAGFIIDGDNIAVALVDRNYGTLVKKLTGGYSLYKYGLYPIVDLESAGRPLSFSPDGKHVLYFAQTAGSNPELIFINVVTTTKKVKKLGKEIEQVKISSDVEKIVIELNDPESPEMSRDGKTIIFSAMQNGQRDIFSLNLETKEVKNLTNDTQFDYAPSFSPDEKTIVYVADIYGYKKLFRLNLETSEKTQLTFGLSNETRPIYSQDGKTIFFISDQDKDKTKNIYSFDTERNTVTQWTNVINGVRIVTPFKDNEEKLLFGAIGYRDREHYFDENLYEMNLTQSQPVANVDNLLVNTEIARTQILYSGTEIDPAKIKKYTPKFSLSQAMFYGGTSNFYGWYGYGYAQLTDLAMTRYIQGSMMSFGEYYTANSFSYFDLSKRVNWGAALSYENHNFYPWFVSWGYSLNGQPAMDEVLYYLRFKRLKLDVVFQYPLDLCHRLEFSLSGTSIKYTSYMDWQAYTDMFGAEAENPTPEFYYSYWLQTGGSLEDYIAYMEGGRDYCDLRADFLKRYINNGKFVTFNFAFVRDTALYKEFGAFTNDMYRFDFSFSPGYNTTIAAEGKKYFRLGSEWIFALKGYAGAQYGKTITPWTIGDLGELRGYEWMQFMGNRIWMFNTELRFPLVKNFNLFGILGFGDIRAALFMDIVKIWFDEEKYNALNIDDINPRPLKGSVGLDLTLGTVPFLGVPLHLSFAKRMTEVKLLPKLEGKWQIKFWFGYSF